MSTQTTYTCDRCKKSGLPGVLIVDLGNDYGQGRDVSEQKRRINRDLCRDCWQELMKWMFPA